MGGWYGGLAGFIGMDLQIFSIRLYYRSAEDVCTEIMYRTYRRCGHRIAKINESTDKKYIFRWSMIASVAGLGFNVIADPIVGYFYKQYILGQPQQMAEVLAKWSAATTL